VPAIQIDRDSMAKWYAGQHFKTDPGIQKIYYLTKNAPDREIRLVEINNLLAELDAHALEPLDFGVDTGAESEQSIPATLVGTSVLRSQHLDFAAAQRCGSVPPATLPSNGD
jgi:hypothetical protein